MNEYVSYLISVLLGAVGGVVVSYFYGAKIKADIQKVLGVAKKVI